MPGLIQESGYGEIFAAAAILRFCEPGVILVSDYKGFVDGILEGEASTTAPGRRYADAWRYFWRQASDYGP
eukprot:1712490-Heterocapsa_arctica.AAC.1